MQLTAKLTQLLPIQIGTGNNGEWEKQDIVVKTDGHYPKKICGSIWKACILALSPTCSL